MLMKKGSHFEANKRWILAKNCNFIFFFDEICSRESFLLRHLGRKN
jgi:hypothetical protein